MTVQDLPSLHRRYVDLAGRFKAAWTFHQFLQGLQKFFAEIAIPQYPTDLAEIHATLKHVSESLTHSDPAAVAPELERASRQLDQTVAVLAAADTRVTPPLLRQFFERVKSYDDQILAQMVRFYLTIAAEEGLAGDRLDKVDFLITKLAEETDRVSGGAVLRDRARLRPIFEGFWAGLEGLSPDMAWIEDRKLEIAAARREVQTISDIDAFSSSQVGPRYREVKRLLGRYLFYPDVLLAVAETNLAFKNKVRQNFHEEEKRILDESQEILSSAERQPGGSDKPDLSQLRQAYQQVEQKQKVDNLKIEDVAFLRRQIEEIRPRLAHGGAVARPGSEHAGDDEGIDEALKPHFREMVAALESIDNQATDREAALSRDVFHLRLEGREVLAYRRIFVAPEGDRSFERLLLEAASLRQCIASQAAEISEILDDTLVTRDAPVFEKSRRTTRLAESFIARFAQMVDEAVRDGSFGEAQQLQLLRMRLLRDYSGLWLLVNRPQS